MKLSEKILKTVSLGYLYHNGKLVLVHGTAHKQAGRVEWVTIHDASTIERPFNGRIVLHNRGTVRLLMSARRVRAEAPSLINASENARERGIACGYVQIVLGASEYHDSVTFNLFENLISGDFTYQPDHTWIEPTVPTRWASYRIAEVPNHGA